MECHNALPGWFPKHDTSNCDVLCILHSHTTYHPACHSHSYAARCRHVVWRVVLHLVVCTMDNVVVTSGMRFRLMSNSIWESHVLRPLKVRLGEAISHPPLSCLPSKKPAVSRPKTVLTPTQPLWKGKRLINFLTTMSQVQLLFDTTTVMELTMPHRISTKVFITHRERQWGTASTAVQHWASAGWRNVMFVHSTTWHSYSWTGN